MIRGCRCFILDDQVKKHLAQKGKFFKTDKNVDSESVSFGSEPFGLPLWTADFSTPGIEQT